MKTLRRLIATLLLLSVLIPLSASDYYTGKGKEDKSFFMLEPVMMNVGAGERAWLPSAISSSLKTNLKLFTGMTPVNLENTAKIQEIQKKVESGAYDASRAVIEAGKLQDADYGVFITVTKTGSTYQLAVSLTDLTTGREEATSSISNIEKETDLQDAAINATIIKLAPQLNVTLTALGIYSLTNSSDGSLDEQIALAKQEAASYQATIEALNRELAGMNTTSAMTDQEILAKKAAAEAEKQLYEQRQQAASLKAQRLLEQKQRADEETMMATARSVEATRKLGQLSSQAEEIAAQVRALQNKQLSVEERITIIENKKAAYMRILQQVDLEMQAYYQQADEDYAALYVDPDDPANYPPAYYKDGVFNRDYRQMLINENEQRRRELQSEAQQNSTAARMATEETLATLLSEIKSDLRSLTDDKFTLSSLEYPEIFKISSYNPNSYSWNADVDFTIFNESCSLVSLVLSYEDVTGEPLPALKTRQDFDDYAATYDIYDAMFRMGTPFLTLEMTYSILPDDDDHPSNYLILLDSYRLIRTTDNKLLREGRLNDNDLELQYYPITDTRPSGETLAVNAIREEEKKQEAVKQAEQAKRDAEKRKAAQKKQQYMNQPDLDYTFGLFTAIMTSPDQASKTGLSLQFDLRLSSSFSMNFGYDFFKTNRILNNSNNLMTIFNCGLEFDHELNFFNLKKCYWFWGFGAEGATYDNCTSAYLTGGLYIPLSYFFALKSSIHYPVWEENYIYSKQRISLGIVTYL